MKINHHPWATGRHFVIGVIVGVLCTGCMAPHSASTKPTAGAAVLPQAIRFTSITSARLTNGALSITGKGYGKADGGKYEIRNRGLLSNSELIRMTIQTADADALNTCLQLLQAARQENQSIDIRGMGTYAIEGQIDPPLDTGVFVLTRLTACGPNAAAPASSAPTVSAAVLSTAAVSAAELVAVPERYLNQPATIMGRLAVPVQFGDPESRLSLQSEGQLLPAYFATQALSADARLSLVHAASASTLILEGTLTKRPGKSGNEFNISKVVSIIPFSTH